MGRNRDQAIQIHGGNSFDAGSGDEAGYVPLDLLWRAVVEQRHRDLDRRAGVERRNRAVPGDPSGGDDVGPYCSAFSAVAFWERQSGQPDVAHSGPQLGRERLRTVDVLGERSDGARGLTVDRGFRGSDFSRDEIEEFINGHTGDSAPGMNRPTPGQVSQVLDQATPTPLTGRLAMSLRVICGGRRVARAGLRSPKPSCGRWRAGLVSSPCAAGVPARAARNLSHIDLFALFHLISALVYQSGSVLLPQACVIELRTGLIGRITDDISRPRSRFRGLQAW